MGTSEKTGERRPFFIEYYVINPGFGEAEPVAGQLPANKKAGKKPCYAMIKAGCWGTAGKAQLHNLYPVSAFSASRDGMDLRIGEHTATETRIKGSVALSRAEADAHPEYMSDAGEMSWDLEAEKILRFSVGWGTSAFFRKLDAFNMYWHAAGMRTRYKGVIAFNGERFRVSPEDSFGYQDKNWGRDYTSPWVWLNCNCLKSRGTGKRLELSSLDVGGAQPVAFGISLPRRLLIALHYEGKFYEWNFSKFWTGSKQVFDCPVYDDRVEWNIDAWHGKAKVEIRFSCPRDTMLNVNYENPDGEKKHNQLWNGGYASGTVRLLERRGGEWAEVDVLEGELGGCEYGEYDR
ncbi:MAG TPA: tocopherol cyclase family protein [Spirochaetales bacterium]|nr:tocopherol cyclase family protein [Spirochaetales bacterium]